MIKTIRVEVKFNTKDDTICDKGCKWLQWLPCETRGEELQPYCILFQGLLPYPTNDKRPYRAGYCWTEAHNKRGKDGNETGN